MDIEHSFLKFWINIIRAKHIKKDTVINITCALNKCPKDVAICFTCLVSFFTHNSGKWCSSWSIIYILSVQIKYKESIDITV